MSSTLLPDRPVRAALTTARIPARVLAWFAADAQRVQAAGSALLVCAATGCTIGLGAGLATDSLVSFLLAAVKGP